RAHARPARGDGRGLSFHDRHGRRPPRLRSRHSRAFRQGGCAIHRAVGGLAIGHSRPCARAGGAGLWGRGAM
ncbi:hypothetical protein LTR94_033513, partial [Friedmanniomyces endolithicus]